MNSLLRTSLCSALIATLAVGVAPQALGEIIIGKGMAGVSLGMTKGEVRAVLGKPKKIEKGRYSYKGKLTVMLRNNSVSGVWTRGRKERTNQGVGVGSPMTMVKKRVPHAKCDGPANNGMECWVDSPGHRVTIFYPDSRKTGKVVSSIGVQ